MTDPTEPTEESQLAGLAHLLRIAEEQAAGAAPQQAADAVPQQAAGAVPPQAAGAVPQQAAGAVPQQAPSPSVTAPLEKVQDPRPGPEAAQGDGRHRLDGARRRFTIPWRRGRAAADS